MARQKMAKELQERIALLERNLELVVGAQLADGAIDVPADGGFKLPACIQLRDHLIVDEILLLLFDRHDLQANGDPAGGGSTAASSSTTSCSRRPHCRA
mgnify:CR=1 FL=1